VRFILTKRGKGHYKKAKYISVASIVSNSRWEIFIAFLLVKCFVEPTSFYLRRNCPAVPSTVSLAVL